MSNKFSSEIFEKPMDRRTFLQLCGVGLASLALSHTRQPVSAMSAPRLAVRDPLLGRVTLQGHKLYKTAAFTAEVLEEMDLDRLRPITGVTVSADSTMPNRIWYELDGVGFAHSGRVQPVRNRMNPENTTIPEDGCLGEVTVPFVDAYSSLEENRILLHRFYYAATFWILDRVVDQEDKVWYELLDDRYYRSFFVPANAVRLVPVSELTAIHPDVPPEKKRLVVDLATQMVTAYEWEKVVFMSRISSGVRLSEGGYATPKGHYRTTYKRPCRHMANAPSEYGSGFDLPGVPWVSYFTGGGVAFHGAYWHNNFGVPSSHGCINMTPQAAKWIYRWTTPTVPPEDYYYSANYGTRVVVQ
ncbi:MAG: L,D-transpeptidase [Chloroflexota bacterium]|nr:L,D-transpeptidase [Chloroflexota bacterium]